MGSHTSSGRPTASPNGSRTATGRSWVCRRVTDSSRSSTLVRVTRAAPGASRRAGSSRSRVLPEPWGPMTPAVRSHGTHSSPPRGSRARPRCQPMSVGVGVRRRVAGRSGRMIPATLRSRVRPRSCSTSPGLAMPRRRRGPQRRVATQASAIMPTMRAASMPMVQASTVSGAAGVAEVVSPPRRVGIQRSGLGRCQPCPAAQAAALRPSWTPATSTMTTATRAATGSSHMNGSGLVRRSCCIRRLLLRC